MAPGFGLPSGSGAARSGAAHLLPGIGGYQAASYSPAFLLANAAPGYAGHMPGRVGENIHGLSIRDANEHAVAEVHALSAGLRPEPPCNLWATSSGCFPGLVPGKRSGRHTLDKVTKPFRTHSEPANARASSSGAMSPARRSPPAPAGPEKPAGVKNIWVGAWSPAEHCSKWPSGR
mmetsp:Transcript_112735/g.351508  ORF Transcript_112735/g.351508 Transcript_112735/m.351508 type:complete len:176 (+) Transcript_112735:102-629(+)